jgi:hypothetical protein
MNKNFLFILFITCVSFVACKKENATLDIPQLADIYPLQVGKIFIYRLDSTVVAPSGTSLIKRSYIAKDSIESEFSDASNRKSFRIYRYITDTLKVQPYKYTATYYATFDATHTEFVDNNLRYINLANPVSENTTWYGNAYINTTLPSSYYYLDQWQYNYQNAGESFTVKKGVIPNTYTVFQNDETQPAVFDAAAYNEKKYGVEVYAKGVGLIYKKFLHWIWQPTPAPAQYQADSYGIELNLIDYK